MRGALGAWLVLGAVVLLVVGVLHFTAPALRVSWREQSLPEGYENRGEFGPFVLFARPDNDAALGAVVILTRFTDAVLAELGGAMHLRPEGGRTEVVVFSDDADLSAFGRSELGSDFRFNGGFYLPAWRTIGVVGSGPAEELAGPLAHEGSHMMLDFWVEASGPQWTRWFDEGLATWFEASDFSRGRVRLGGVRRGIVRRARQGIAEGNWPGIGALFAAPPEAWESEDNWLFYSKAAMLVHLLLEGEEGTLRDRFFAWFEAERRPGPADLAEFERVVGPAEEIEARLRAHVLALGR